MTKITLRQSARSVLLAIALAGGAAVPSLAQMGPPPTLTTTALGQGAYWIRGDAANTGFVVGPDGVVVIDTQRSVAAAKTQIAQIARITNKPIKAVIATHGDPDHIGGFVAYAPDVEYIAHENIRAQILATAREPAEASPAVGNYRAIAEQRLPSHTVAFTETDRLAGVETRLIHVAPAHSSGDLIVYFPRQKVVFVGDLLTTGESTFPILHVGGSSAGWLQMMREVLALPAKTFVAGHGGLLTRAELVALVNTVAERRAAIKAMVMAGKSFDEIDAALPEAKRSPMFLGFNETTWSELTAGYPKQLAPWISMRPNDPRKAHVAPGQ